MQTPLLFICLHFFFVILFTIYEISTNYNRYKIITSQNINRLPLSLMYIFIITPIYILSLDHFFTLNIYEVSLFKIIYAAISYDISSYLLHFVIHKNRFLYQLIHKKHHELKLSS